MFLLFLQQQHLLWGWHIEIAFQLILTLSRTLRAFLTNALFTYPVVKSLHRCHSEMT